METVYETKKQSKEEEIQNMIGVIHGFFQSRPESTLRLADLWKLIRLENEDHPTVVYWKNKNKEKHGIPVEVSTALEDDKRFIRISIGRNEVYYKLSGR